MHTGVTIKELGWIEEALRLETLSLKLTGVQAQSANDPELKQFFGRCQRQAQERIQQFSNVLASAAGQGQSQFAEGAGQAAGAGAQRGFQYGQSAPQYGSGYPYQQPYAWQGGPH